MKIHIRKKLMCLFIIFLTVSVHYGAGNNLPEGFVYLDEVIPDIVIELRYAGENNFVGEPVDGYESGKCIISADAAYALKRVQTELRIFGLGLKIFDAFRPQRAVDHFGRWAEDTVDTKMKKQYYPNVKKTELHEKGYIGKKSGHTRGSTVDLTLIDLSTGEEIDMGSPWDYFDEKSHTAYSGITAQQGVNRLMLKLIMMEYGFKPYAKEWWHFTLSYEPFPETYFDFIIK